MVLLSGRDTSIQHQGIIRNAQHSSPSSSLGPLPPAPESQRDRERSRSEIAYGGSGELPSMRQSRREKGVGCPFPTSKAPPVGSRSFTLQDDDAQAGISRSPPTPSSGRSNRPKGQGQRKGISEAPGAPGDDRIDSSIPTDGSHGRRNRASKSSRRSFPRLLRTLEDMGNENPGKALQGVLEKEKELLLLCRKLGELEAEKAAGFPPTDACHTGGETPEEPHILRAIIQESKLAVPITKPYSGLNYAQQQSFVRSCEHIFCTRPTTYRKDVHKVLYGIGLLEGTPSTSWYRYEERYGRLDTSWDAFKTLLLDDICPPEIRLQDAHKKYREAKQRTGQTVHALVRYLEGLEAQMVPVTEDDQISTILRALHPWIEAQVSSRLESPKTKSKVVQLALKIESIYFFRPTGGGGDQANRGSSSQTLHTTDHFGGTRPAKRARPEDKSAELLFGSAVSAKPWKRRS